MVGLEFPFPFPFHTNIGQSKNIASDLGAQSQIWYHQ